MLYLKRVPQSTHIAHLRLLHPRVLEVHFEYVSTVVARKACGFHFGVYIRASYDDAPEEDKPADHIRPQILHTERLLLIEMLNLHHQPSLPIGPRHPRRDVRLGLDEVLLVESLEDIVEAGDHLGGEVDELQVQLAVELLYVPPVDREAMGLRHLHVVQLSSVHLLGYHLALHRVAHLKLKNKSLHRRHRTTNVDRGPVDVLALLGLHLEPHEGRRVAFRLEGREGGPDWRLSEVGVRIADHRLFIEQPPNHAHISPFKK